VILSNVNNTPLRVFDDAVVEFLSGISSELLKSPLVRAYPDLSAFAFYVRKTNLLKLREILFPKGTEGRIGRGLCFHVAPGNIPVNFAFTWIFGLLAGNANIVRLPSKSFPQVDALLTVLNHHLDANPELRSRNAFVRYPRTDTEQTSAYCRMADCRMIWGGDQTIAGIKAMATSPRCVDIAFADRYSVGMIDGAAIVAADAVTMERLAQDFYNDTYLMDQNACSSPQLILWEHDSEAARQKFWDAVLALAEKKYQMQDAVAVDKYTSFCEEAATNPAVKSIARKGNLLTRVELSTLNPEIIDTTKHRGKAGFFFEYSLSDRKDFFDIVTEKFQTITFFGVDPHALHAALCTLHARGIDRIVPFGKAMDIGAIWDGHDLIRELSRVIFL